MGNKQEEFDQKRVTYWVTLPTDVSPTQVASAIRSIGSAGVKRSLLQIAVPTTVFETITEAGTIRHRIRVPFSEAEYLMGQLRSSIPGIDYQMVERGVVDDWHFDYGVEISMNTPDRPLDIKDPIDLSSRLLSSVQSVGEGEIVVMQWLITQTSRHKVPDGSKPQPSTKWSVSGALLGSTASPREITARTEKLREPNFLVAGRIASGAKSSERAERLVGHVTRALMAENGEVSFKTRPIPLAKTNTYVSAAVTPKILGMQMTVTELTPTIAWPLGPGYVAGLNRKFTRHFPVSEMVPRLGIVLGRSTVPGNERPVAMSFKGSTMHTANFGSNGTGKTTVYVNAAEQIMDEGCGLVIIEADGDLIARVIDRVPRDRVEDVILVDFNDEERFVGLNPLDLESPEHVASRLIAIFEKTFENQSINTRTLVGFAMRALGSVQGANIGDMPVYLNPVSGRDKRWAGMVDAQIHDFEVKGFMKSWRQDMNGRNRASRLRDFEPVEKRLWELLLPTQSRYMLNQAKSAFTPQEVIEGNKLLFINLKGVPEQVASVVGSLVTGLMWDAAKKTKPAKPNYLMLDECHLFTKLDHLVIDALATGRKRDFCLMLATQYPERLSRDLQNAIGTNARTQLTFACGPTAASLLSRQFGDRNVTAELLQNLEKYHAVGRVMTDDGQSPVLTLKTMPESPGKGTAAAAIAISNFKYSESKERIDAQNLARRAVADDPRKDDALIGDEPIEDWKAE